MGENADCDKHQQVGSKWRPTQATQREGSRDEAGVCACVCLHTTALAQCVLAARMSNRTARGAALPTGSRALEAPIFIKPKSTHRGRRPKQSSKVRLLKTSVGSFEILVQRERERALRVQQFHFQTVSHKRST